MIYVKVDDKYLEDLAKAVSYSEDAVAGAVGEAALFHANYVLNEMPAAVQGKLFVQIADVSGSGEFSAEITYTMKPSGEGATTTAQKTFLPMQSLGATSRRTVVSRSGEQGIFVTGMTTLGRTSIQNYLMKQAGEAVRKAEAPTLEVAVQAARQGLLDWFTSNGILYNSDLGRFVSTEATQLPWGTNVNPSTIIGGNF